ncbi:MAG: ABC transporter permease subunit [Gammaproteobacteria bacterium]|nr:ABC transporter permease subunit [Gammaproteobacteria bacterium]
MILTIARREFKNLFLSPLAWVVLAVVQTILAIIYLLSIRDVIEKSDQLMALEGIPGVTEMIVPSLYANAAMILLLVTPLLTMRLIAEERRNRTLPLLFSSPISMTEVVLGKYLGVLLFLWLLLAMIALMPLSLIFGGPVDFGLLGAATLGLALTLASFAAIGLFMSTLTQHPIVAAIGAFGLSLFFWIVDWSGQGDIHASVPAYLSLFNHYLTFLKGIFDSTAAVYYALLVVTFLTLSIRRLDADRLGG